jgi:hypothetical protein
VGRRALRAGACRAERARARARARTGRSAVPPARGAPIRGRAALTRHPRRTARAGARPGRPARGSARPWGPLRTEGLCRAASLGPQAPRSAIMEIQRRCKLDPDPCRGAARSRGGGCPGQVEAFKTSSRCPAHEHRGSYAAGRVVRSREATGGTPGRPPAGAARSPPSAGRVLAPLDTRPRPLVESVSGEEAWEDTESSPSGRRLVGTRSEPIPRGVSAHWRRNRAGRGAGRARGRNARCASPQHRPTPPPHVPRMRPRNGGLQAGINRAGGG